MAVYVGKSFPTGGSCRWPYKKTAHLFADTVEELQSFAVNKLYLKLEWYQAKSTPHFDLTTTKRLLAIKQGAIPFKNLHEEGRWTLEKKGFKFKELK